MADHKIMLCQLASLCVLRLEELERGSKHADQNMIAQSVVRFACHAYHAHCLRKATSGHSFAF